MNKTRSRKSRDTVPLIFILWVARHFSKSVLPATNRMLNISQYSLPLCDRTLESGVGTGHLSTYMESVLRKEENKMNI
jgi:hypothetical protein